VWLPGHMAFSFLICLPLIVHLKRERALALSYVMFFSLLPDFLHLGPLRYLSHSLVGLGAMLLMVFIPLVALSRPRPALLLLAAAAAGGHLLGDAYIGSIAPFYPWSLEWFQVNEFNSAFDIRMEVVFFTIAAVIITVALRPWRSITSVASYSARERRGLLLTALPAMAITGLEGAYFIIVSQGPGLGGYRSMLLACFMAIFLVSVVLLSKSVGRTGHKLSDSIIMGRDIT